jgi:hypothetical protein
MILIRTFHPIGQGAFYTESHKFNGTKFTIVYDCGSSTFKGKKLETKIKSTFPKDHPIDILFISHFHADHISGIEILAKHCKIKKVVIPLIDDTAKILLKVTNLLDNNYSDTSLIDSPEDFFGGDIPIIRIEPTEINPNTDGIGLNDPTDISKIVSSTNNPSGTVFAPLAGIDWFFIPFNYKHDERKKQFEAALNTLGLTLADIDTINKINKNKDIIIKAYSNVDGDLNTNSMILYSGKNSNYYLDCFNHFSSFYFHRRFHSELQSGCLYLGDIDLNEPGIVADINAKLRQLLPYIGTLQVPHHGSIHNFASAILQTNIYCAIFSYGTTNTYGHPSDKVIGEIISNNIFPHLVTEIQQSMITQWK